jgi:hypothetical protein
MNLYESLQSRLRLYSIYDGITKREAAPAQGWTTSYYEDSLREFLKKQPLDKQCLIVEVGTWMGASAIQAANIIRDLNRRDVVVCIDTWLGSPEHFLQIPKENGFPVLYKQFLQNIVNHGHTDRVLPIALPSLQAIKVLQALYPEGADAIYIDAAHEFLPVFLDVISYWDYLKIGGRMLGDDYTEHWPGVKQAVNRFVGERGLKLDILNDWVWKIDKI